AIDTSAGRFDLGMKIGLGVGDVTALSVGGVRDRWQYIIAGDPLRQVAEAEHQAQRGEIVLSAAARDLLAAAPADVAVDQPAMPATLPATPDLIDALQAYIPDAASYRLIAGHADWLADLRRMSVIFLSIGGINAAAEG
ncbi:MAG TPA: hypothetical protein PKC19_11360, partial [Roseiflexaceae bacterium]|nr:hypothetical protein [Roseiflexaceae bacterium]